MAAEFTTLVLDSGSWLCKAGFAGEARPRAVFPAVVGRPIDTHTEGERSLYVGEEAESAPALTSLDYPVRRGVVSAWEDLEAVWRHALYTQLHASPQKHPLLIAEAPSSLHRRQDRERVAEIVFETFDCPALYLAVQAALALYATGRVTGLVLDSGDGVTHSVPVFEGYTVRRGVTRLDLAGRDLTDFLAKSLADRGYSFTSHAELEAVRTVKENLCCVAEDFDQQVQSFTASPQTTSGSTENSFPLPDGRVITIGAECFRCPEPLFRPALLGLESPGVHEISNASVLKCDSEIRPELYANILLAGGSTMFSGFGDRLKREIAALAPGTGAVEVISPPDRSFSAWLGGSMMASMSSFKDMWISKQEFQEYGPTIVHRKCF